MVWYGTIPYYTICPIRDIFCISTHRLGCYITTTINETLNGSENKSDLPNKFLVGIRTITDRKENANSFNALFSTI